MTLSCLGAGNAAEAVEVLSLGYILNGLSGTWQSVISSGVYAGMLVGGIGSGIATDASGDRRSNFLRALALATSGALLGALSVHPAMLFIFRVVAGVGVGAATPPLFALAAEVAPPKWRGACITYVAAWWMVGSLFAAGLAKILFVRTSHLTVDFDQGFPLWRIYALICAIPALFATLAAAKFIVVQQPSRDEDVFDYDDIDSSDASTTNNGEPVLAHNPMASRSRPGDNRTKKKKKKTSSSTTSSVVSGSTSTTTTTTTTTTDHEDQRPWQPGLVTTGEKDAFDVRTYYDDDNDDDEIYDDEETTGNNARKRRSQTKRRKLTTLGVTYWGLNFGYYGLATWITVVLAKVGVKDVYGVALLYAGANLPGNIVAFFLIESLGRKVLLALSMGTATVAALILAGALELEEKTALAMTIVLAMLFNAATTAGWAALDALTAESFPRHDRASAVGFLTAVGRVASIAAQYINGALQSSPPLLLSVTAAFMFFGTITIAGVRELKNVQLD